jgi:hypothetical protein
VEHVYLPETDWWNVRVIQMDVKQNVFDACLESRIVYSIRTLSPLTIDQMVSNMETKSGGLLGANCGRLTD